MNTILHVGRHAITTTVSRHIHRNWELIFCTSGSGELIFDDRTLSYSSNDIAIIPPFLPHSNRSREGFTNIHINMDDLSLSGTEPMIVPADPNSFLLDAFRAAFYYYTSASDEQGLLLSTYGQLISAHLTAYQPKHAHGDVVQDVENNILHNFSNCNYDLNAYLRSLPFSFEYLKKLFKKETGMTPLQFLTVKRLENAAGVLATYYDKSNISEVARLCGFNDPLYFSRLFKKKYGVSPRSYILEPPPTPVTDSDSMKIML